MALINVARARTTCPICGKNDWCMISEDGKLALCQRIKNGHPNKKGGWWHSLEKIINYNKNSFTKTQINRKAPTPILNAVYQFLLNNLVLNSKHEKDLTQRGITKDEIRFFNYKSFEMQGRYDIAKKIRKQYGEKITKHIPGLYTKDGKYGNYLAIAGGTGFTIPTKNLDGLIWGIQIRVDKPTKDTKYIWLSSADKRDGSNSGTPLHIAIPPSIESSDIWITEGPLKANVLSWRRKCISIAAPGIGHWTDIPKEIIRIKDKYKVSGNIIIAYDADYKEKEYVKEHALALHFALKEKEINNQFAVWDINQGKGIDDVLINKGSIRLKDII